MQRSFGLFLFLTVLIIGLGVGEIVWTRFEAPSCRDWQTELQRRVESYARLHLPEPAPQVQVQGSCGKNSLPDALYFRWHVFSWRMGWRSQKPLEEGDLRMAATRDLMQHPDMGSLKFTVRFDPALNADTRKRVEELISHYLMVDDQRQKLEFKRLKKGQESVPVKGTVLAPLPPALVKSWGTPKLASPEPQLRASLIKVCNAVCMILLVCLGGYLLLASFQGWRRSAIKPKDRTSATPPRDSGAFAILFAPRVMQDFGERGRDLWHLLLKIDEKRAIQRVRQWWEKDQEGLLQFLGLLSGPAQESILQYLTTDQLLKLTDTTVNPQPRAAHRAALRILLDLGRELSLCSQLTQAPLFIHLMTKREWQRVAQQMTRPRRRALSEMLDKERTSWLRARQDLHPGWFTTGVKEEMSSEQLVRRIRAILQVDADQLREQLYADPEAIRVVDSYFADLTLDAGLNSDLAMLVLGECQNRQAGFGRLVERRDPALLTALQQFEDQQVALLLYEADTQIKAQLYSALGPRQDAISTLVMAMEQDRQHSKSLRMQARSLQRFVERQVLVADLLCTTAH